MLKSTPNSAANDDISYKLQVCQHCLVFTLTSSAESWESLTTMSHDFIQVLLITTSDRIGPHWSLNRTVTIRDVNETRETRDSKKFLGIEH